MHLPIIPVDQTSKAAWEFFLKNNLYLYMQIDHLYALPDSYRNVFSLAHSFYSTQEIYLYGVGGMSSQLKQMSLLVLLCNQTDLHGTADLHTKI